MLIELWRNVNWKRTNVCSLVVILHCGVYFPRFRLFGRHESGQATSTCVSADPRMSLGRLQLRALSRGQRDGPWDSTRPFHPFNGQRSQSAVRDCNRRRRGRALRSRSFRLATRTTSSKRGSYPGDRDQEDYTCRYEQAEWTCRLASHHRARAVVVSNISSTEAKLEASGQSSIAQ